MILCGIHSAAPSENCSLKDWLNENELSHLEGFLSAVGVHCVSDLAYVTEEDLQLLKPVARRRLLTLPSR